MNNKLFLILFLILISITSFASGQLLYSTYLGGSITDYGQAIAIDSALFP